MQSSSGVLQETRLFIFTGNVASSYIGGGVLFRTIYLTPQQPGSEEKKELEGRDGRREGD